MSLVKSPTMTEKKIAANRHNQNLSHGPTTEEGKERVGAAHLRHGYYSRTHNAVLRGLGEDPAQFEQLLDGLYEEFTPRSTLQEVLVSRLARVLCLIDRADHVQEGIVLRRARSVDLGRDNRLHARMMRLKMTAGSLHSLACAVAAEHYVTRPNDLELMKGLQEEPELDEMGGIAVVLFTQLQDPGAVDEFGRPTDTQEQQAQVLMRIKEIFGLAGPDPSPHAAPGLIHASEGAQGPDNNDTASAAEARPAARPSRPNPYRHISAEQWEAREPVRQLLENILTRQAEACEALRTDMRKDAAAGPSPYERAAELAPSHTDALLMRRVQDANMREVRRITNLLLKMKRQEGTDEAAEPNGADPVAHDVVEKKET